MEFAVELLSAWLRACIQLLIHPFFYLGILLIILQHRRQIVLERKLFHARLHYLLGEIWRFLLWGLAAGLFASVIMLVLGPVVSQEAVLLLWGVSLVLVLFRIRFLCIAYSAGVLGVLKGLLDMLPQLHEQTSIHWLVGALDGVNVPALLALAGILHLVEAMLIRVQGTRAASPLFFAGKRGRIVGGYYIQGFWPVPLFLLVPASMSTGFELPWPALFAGNGAAAWSLAAFPVMLGFTERTITMLPKQKTSLTARRLSVYALSVIILALAAYYVPLLLVPAALITIGLHELLIHLSDLQESNSSPLFVHPSQGQGLKILSVLPGSPAAELGILPGEVLYKVNGMEIHNKDELHQAMRLNSAFCKMELLNLEGQSKFASRAVFSGDHHQLGIVLCPDQDALYYVEEKPRQGLLAYLFRQLSGVTDNRKRPATEEL